MTNATRNRWHHSVFAAGVLLSAMLAAAPVRGSTYVVPVPPEPTRADVLSAAKLDAAGNGELTKRLGELLRGSPELIDVWLPAKSKAEQDAFSTDYLARMEGHEPTRFMPPETREKLVADLRQRRLADPARLVDAVFRRLGEVGGRAEFAALADHAEVAASRPPHTPWGRWKALASMAEIANRLGVDVLEPAPACPPDHVAPLISDLEPEAAGPIATEWLNRLEAKAAKTYFTKIPLRTRLWLATAMADADPVRAAGVLAAGLESRDPATRLFAGLAIARLGDGRVPFRLTAPPEQTRADRTAWLVGLKPHRPAAFAFADPLDEPFVFDAAMRADLLYLDGEAKVARRTVDVWPNVRRVLPDGTFYARLPGVGVSAAALASPEGETLVTFPDDYGDGRWDGGRLWADADDGRVAGEYAPWGEPLWAMPTGGQQAARDVGPAGRGRVVLLRRGAAEIVDRRGDIVWSARDGFSDPRHASMIDADTVIVSCSTEVQVRHRTKGLLRRIEGFRSTSEVRYHPDRPWVIHDGGESSAVLYDPKTDHRATQRLAGSNGDVHAPSRFLRPHELVPD